MSEQIGIVAAMVTEVTPLVAQWRRSQWDLGGVKVPVFESGKVTLVCGGIGPQAGMRAAEALVERIRPALLMSVGLAGALREDARVGEVLRPAEVVNSATGARFSLSGGAGVLISSATIAGVEEKADLRRRFPDALAVDMEGAIVAETAAFHGIRCMMVKAVSDKADFPMPPLGRFVDPQGQLRNAALIGHAILRPALWGVMLRLARNSGLAARQLADAVAPMLSANAFKNLKLTTESRVY
ncbi:MAG TPA: hypothetical protein VFU76_08525 [Terriglobales bacterium]|nr:hypothetical protein [Terriglobales bacterium]